jgi:hypothetical protein
MTTGFQFDEATHSYTQEGHSIPSCTRVLDHAGLVSYDQVRQDILERKSRIGTIVHLATQYYDRDTLDWDSFSDSDIDQENKRRVEAWARFRLDTNFAPTHIEERYVTTVNGMLYGLTVDLVGLIGGRETILDIKTSVSAMPWYAIQTAGYAMGVPGHASPRAMFINRRRMIVQLFPDGRYKKHDFTEMADADVFLSCLHISHWKLNKGLKLKEIEEAA